MRHFLITGSLQEGKTAFAGKIAEILSENGFKIGGFLSKGYFDNVGRAGFDLEPVSDKKKKIRLAERENIACPANRDYIPFGNFIFFKDALAFGEKIYNESVAASCCFIFIDEAGLWELQGGGWHNILKRIPENSSLIVVARDKFAENINNVFFNGNMKIFNISEYNEKRAANMIMDTRLSSYDKNKSGQAI